MSKLSESAEEATSVVAEEIKKDGEMYYIPTGELVNSKPSLITIISSCKIILES